MSQPTNQLTLPEMEEDPGVLHVILHKPYEEIKAFSEWLKDKSNYYLVGEHDADEQVKTTHCHILIEGLKVSREGLRKQIQKYSPGKGQNCTMERTEKTRVKYKRNYLAVYILKGDMKTYRSGSFNEFSLEMWVGQWVNRKTQEEKTSLATSKDTVAEKPRKTIYMECDEILTYIMEKRDSDVLDIKTAMARTDLVKEIINWANRSQKPLHAYKVAEYYDICLQQAVPETYGHKVWAIINNRHRFSHA